MSQETPMRERAQLLFREIQSHICSSLEALDGKATFQSDAWTRTDIHGGDGGGGLTRILANGAVFEKAGVSFSSVQGTMPASFAAKLGAGEDELPFFATGTSLVIHPHSPMVPTTHANFRYIELGEKSWFGGGSDLTPYYLFEEDARHFHQVLKNSCDRHDPAHYPRFKKWCDEYFYLPHRKEARGIGGIFYDYLGRDSDDRAELEKLFAFSKEIGFAFTEQYLPIVLRCKELQYSELQRQFQLQRRGRYVEFNLLYDRGTHFGLQTGGRTESILMSLPALVRWDYCPIINEGSPEAALMAALQEPREWV